jgi:UDP-N-acetylglucosamine transferase subunit ALG13
VIFVTVGAQMPFDRLVRTVDRWAERRGRSDVFAQIGPSEYRPAHLRWARFLDPQDFRKRYETASVIVAHAGTGSILTALQLGKPIVVMPRRARLHETRSDHQVASAERFSRFPSVEVASDERALLASLERIEELRGLRAIGAHASAELLNALRRFVDRGLPRPLEDEDDVLDAARNL